MQKIHGRGVGVFVLLAGLLIPMFARWAHSQTPSYCLACLEAPEGEPGTRLAAPNWNRLDLFFLDDAAILVSTATTVAPAVGGKRLDMVSVAPNGLLYGASWEGRQETLHLNQAISKATIGSLWRASQTLDAYLADQWRAVLTDTAYGESIQAMLARHGLKTAEDVGRNFNYVVAMQPGEPRKFISPTGTTACEVVQRTDLGNRDPDGYPLGYDLLVLRSLDVAGTATLALGGDEGWRIGIPSWSPDGTRLAFTRVASVIARHVESPPEGEKRVEGAQLCVLDVASGEVKSYGPKSCTMNASQPQWSPNGTRLLVSLDYDDPTMPIPRYPSGGIFLLDLKTGDSRRLSPFGVSQTVLSWSPTGDRYLFLAFDPPHSGARTRLLYSVGQIEPPSQKAVLDVTKLDVRHEIVWSPDGRYLACLSAVKENGAWVDRILVMDAWGIGAPRVLVRSALVPRHIGRHYLNLAWLNLPVR